MKTFKDVSWKQHKLGKGNIQGLLTLDNGIELSIVAGKGMYSSGNNGVRESIDKFENASSFEVAIFDQAGNFIGADNDLVLGWQSREDIDKLIQIHS
tara:strand:+ start:57 stop:347 length:291 start_codon:yes stop_codon:yes gene_type:complete